MRQFISTTLIAMLVLCSTTLQAQTKLKKYILAGSATNATMYAKGSATITITQLPNKKYKCEGRFDEKTLFGRFEMEGERVPNPEAPKALSISFKGKINFGDGDHSGFEPGTQTTFYSTFNIYSDNATGEYLIDEIPNGEEWSATKQHGLYTVQLVSKQSYIVK